MERIFHRIEPGKFEVAPDVGVLKADDYRALCGADEIVEEARREAERILKKAEAAYEEMKEKGYRDGLMEGKMEISQQMISNVAKTVSYFASIEGRMVEIVTSALKKIIGSIPKDELIVSVVRNGLTAIRNQKQVTVRVAPEDLERVRSRMDGILADFPTISFVEVEADSRLEPGGCILESDIGTVDATIDVQLSAMEKAISQVFGRRE